MSMVLTIRIEDERISFRRPTHVHQEFADHEEATEAAARIVSMFGDIVETAEFSWKSPFMCSECNFRAQRNTRTDRRTEVR